MSDSIAEPTLKKKKTTKKPIICETPEDRVPYSAFDKMVARSLPENHRGIRDGARNILHKYMDKSIGRLIKGAIVRSKAARRQSVNFADVDQEFTKGFNRYVPKFKTASDFYRTFLNSVIHKKQAIAKKKKTSGEPRKKKKKKNQVVDEEDPPVLELAA